MSSPILIASNNRHKIAEFRRILAPFSFELLSPADVGIALDVPETRHTFADNARKKAEAFASKAGLIALADDSGLVVDALGGEPGIYSARYGGPEATDEDRVRLVLDRMLGVPADQRTARFVAAVALAGQAFTTVVFEGTVEGLITAEPRGEHGFGYDPIFFYPAYGCTLAEAEPFMKDEVSHRAKALRQAAQFLRLKLDEGILD